MQANNKPKLITISSLKLFIVFLASLFFAMLFSQYVKAHGDYFLGWGCFSQSSWARCNQFCEDLSNGNACNRHTHFFWYPSVCNYHRNFCDCWVDDPSRCVTTVRCTDWGSCGGGGCGCDEVPLTTREGSCSGPLVSIDGCTRDSGCSCVSPPSCSVRWSPSTIRVGQSSTISWSSQNDADGWLDVSDCASGSVSASGSYLVGPFSSSGQVTCTLTARNSAGSYSCSDTLNVWCVATQGWSCGRCGTIDCYGNCVNQGPCSPRQTEYGGGCGKCGILRRDCAGNCQWGGWYCTGEGPCSPGQTQDTGSCGYCGTLRKTCQSNCQWGTGTCVNQGSCSPGEFVTQSCGNCGTQTSTCQSNCQYGPWGACTDQGPCAPGQTQNLGGCGNCGTLQQTCQSNCQWSSSTCVNEGPCSSGSTQSQACGNCGTQTRTCTSSCSWSGWGACTNQGPCPAGSRQCSGTSTQLCNAACQWTTGEDCATKSSTDTDGSPTAYTTAGTVTDYTTCSAGNCLSNSYPDSCASTMLTEYGASGASFISGAKECQDYESIYCSGNRQYRREYGCSGSPGSCSDAAVPDPLIGTDADADGVDQQCEDVTCDNTPGVCDTAVAGKCIAKQTTETLCSDNLDNDCDNRVDDFDNNCLQVPSSSQCEQDCTYTFDELVHSGCRGYSGCTFYDDITQSVCDWSQPGWVRDYNSTHYVECASGSPQLKIEIKADVSCASGTLVKMTRIVVYNGKPVKLVVAVCG